MSTENINIVIKEDGSRVVTRNLQDLSKSGDTASKSMDTLARGLEVLAAAFAIDKLKEYADEWASITGIIEVATKTHQEATAVITQLFDAAQAVRTPIDEMAQLYSRAARAAGDLGASQQQAIQFTKEVGEALVVQHTSASQASGALLQLGQLLGTGKVRAQEFNSVNENLSVVLQVVARNIDAAGGSVNKLKGLVEKGTVGSKEFFEAFLKGSDGLQRDFDKSAFTIAQGFTLIHNSIVKMIGDLNEATGASNTIGGALKFVADHMGDVEAAIIATTKLLATGAAAWAAYATAQALATGASKLGDFIAYTNAVARGDIVILGSAEALRQRAVAAVVSAAADVRAAAAAESSSLIQARAAVAAAETTTAEIVAKQAFIDVVRQDIAATLAAAAANEKLALSAVATASSLGDLAGTTEVLAAAEAQRNAALSESAALRSAELVIETELTAALGAQAVAQAALTEATVAGDAAMTAATLTLAKAQETAAVATAAAAGTTGRLAQVFSLLRGVVAPVIGAVSEFFALIAANPITALIVALVTATGLLLGFGDRINAGVDSITTLGDVMDVLKDRAKSAFASLSDYAASAWASLTAHGQNALGTTTTAVVTATTGWTKNISDALTTSETGFAGFAIKVARTFDAIGGLLLGFVFGLKNTLTVVPELFTDAFKTAANDVGQIIEDMINSVIGGLNKVAQIVGLSLIQAFKIPKLDIDEAAFADAGVKLGSALGDGMDQGFKAEGQVLENAIQSVLNDAQAKAAAAREAAKFALAAANQVDLTTHGKPNKTDNSAEYKKEEEALRHLLDTIDPTTGAILELDKANKILTEGVKLGILAQNDSKNGFKSASDYAKALALHYRDIIDPLGAYNRALDESNSLQLVDFNDRQATQQALKLYNDLKSKDVILTLAQVSAERAKIQSGIDLARQIGQQDSLIQESVNKRRDFQEQLNAITALLANPASGYTQGDAAQKILSIFPDLLDGTKTFTDANVALYKDMYDKIDALVIGSRITQATADTARARIALQSQQRQTQQYSDFFGNLASLSQLGNKRLAAIGKAAAIAQASIDGYAAIQKAYAAPPGWPYNAGSVIAVSVATAANVAKIAGFESGGYTGNGGVSDVAGVVHGQEYVVNASATAKNRTALEAMNAGATVGTGSQPVVVIVNNNGSNTTATTKETNTPTGKQIEVMIEDKVAKSIRSGGKVADAMESQYALQRSAGVTSR